MRAESLATLWLAITLAAALPAGAKEGDPERGEANTDTRRSYCLSRLIDCAKREHEKCKEDNAGNPDAIQRCSNLRQRVCRSAWGPGSECETRAATTAGSLGTTPATPTRAPTAEPGTGPADKLRKTTPVTPSRAPTAEPGTGPADKLKTAPVTPSGAPVMLQKQEPAPEATR